MRVWGEVTKTIRHLQQLDAHGINCSDTVFRTAIRLYGLGQLQGLRIDANAALTRVVIVRTLCNGNRSASDQTQSQ